ncbi:hypothetical protein [Flavobacterium collinsii]|uniref:DUF3999 domain-containing protein n=1 Tax=Flavobacterium collinsii TaxID=1114861 RepID=A0A9W4TE52_9FLAO|nr:hypothetical protein [Flavobacterium collinsii]CAI2765276.1 conserved protein of unknown function [Flavobacterium collinsii]
MKLNKFILLLFFANLSFGQYQTTGKIKPISEKGFHEIVLSPEIRSYSKQDLSDIRLFDSKGNEVPYFIQTPKNNTINTFEEYTITSKTATPKKHTSVIIAIPSDKNHNQISLFIANSDVEKRYTVSGSDDQKEWFGISNAQILDELSSASETSVIKTITYPLNTYRYLKIDFDDQKTLPVNILKAGNFTNQTHQRSLQEITSGKSTVTENHSKKETQIRVLFDAPQIINQISFEITKPTYYSRKAVLYKKGKRQLKRKSTETEEEIATFELNSNVKNTFAISEIFEKELFIKIENNDNPPLSILKVKFSQNPVSMVAELNLNENYILKTGNKSMTAPDYDLSAFKNNIASNLPQTFVYAIQQKATVKNQTQNKSFWQQSWFMWLCILLGGATILFFTTSLVKDLKKKNGQ